MDDGDMRLYLRGQKCKQEFPGAQQDLPGYVFLGLLVDAGYVGAPRPNTPRLLGALSRGRVLCVQPSDKRSLAPRACDHAPSRCPDVDHVPG